MSDRFKIVYIGAGSFRFSIVLFFDICRAIKLSPIEVWLVDIDEKSLDIMTRAFKNMVKKAKRRNQIDIKVFSTSDRTEAMQDADFIYKSISVGIQKSEWFDNYLPLKFGLPQNTGDTLGAGGLFRSFRTNHIVADIARDMKKFCPKAPLLNYTNPQASIVMSARAVAPDVQYIGLCHELFGGMKILRKWYNKKMGGKVKNWEDFNYEYAGVNHFTFITKFGYKGNDLYPELREQAHSLVLDKKIKRNYNFHLLEKYGFFPYAGGRHIAEFMTEYYNYFNYKIQSPYWNFPVVRNVPGLDKQRRIIYKLYNLIAKGIIVPKPRNIGEKAIEMTLDWKDSLNNENNINHVVNIPNNHPSFGLIVPELPEDCIVEVPGHFKNGIITPIKKINLSSEIADLVRPHAEQQRLTVNASLGNSMDLCIKAMQHDTMANWIEDDEKLEYLTKLMLYYQKQWLPESWKEWIPSENELKESKWWISPEELSLKGKNYLKIKFAPDEKLKKKAYFWSN